MAKLLIHSMIFAPDGVSTAYLYSDLASRLRNIGYDVTVLTTTPHFNVMDSALKRQPLIRKRGNWLFFSKFEDIPVWHIAFPIKTSDTGARIRSIFKFHIRALQFGLLTNEKFDVILAPSPPLTIGAVSWLLAKRFHAKAVYNVQEIYPDFAIDQGVIENPILIWLLRKLEKFVYSSNEMIVTIGDRFKEIIAARGVPRDKLVTIPNFVDSDLYKPLPRDNSFARKHGLFEKFVVMYAGNIGLAQDWEPLFYAANKLADLPIQFVVIGNGARRRWLEDELLGRKFRNVLILDYQPWERMPEINASCDIATILMNPKVTADGFPSKIYTTMACEKPSVIYCSEDSELISIVTKSKCGTWINDGDLDGYVDAIRSYYNECERLVIEGKDGRKYVVEHNSKKKVAEMYDSLLRSITDNSKDR